MSKTRLYRIWQGMKRRCNNPKAPDFPRYGGRGITVTKRWLKFENFYNDMHEAYQDHIVQYGEKDTQIDRVNNNWGYSKSNCRWVTAQQNSLNRRTNRLIPYRGDVKSLKQWARELNLSRHVIQWRLKNGWSTEKALTTPVMSFREAGKLSHSPINTRP